MICPVLVFVVSAIRGNRIKPKADRLKSVLPDLAKNFAAHTLFARGLAGHQAAVSAVEKYISTTVPVLPLCFRDYDLVVSNGVRGLVSNEISDPSGRFWDVIDWRLASGR